MGGAIVVAVAGAAFVETTAGIIAAALINIGLGLVLNFAVAALSKPKGAQKPSLTVSIRQADAPWAVRYGEMRVGGVVTFVQVSGSKREYLDIVVTLSGHHIEEIGDIFLDGRRIALQSDGTTLDSSYAGHVFVGRALGSADQPAIRRAGGLTVHEKWTTDHRQRGRAHAYVRLKWSEKIFRGIPNISFMIKGSDEIYDPRTATIGYSTNPALIIAHYLTNTSYGLGADWSEIDEDLLIESANICDELVPLSGGTQGARYRCDGSFDVDEAPKDILEALLTSMAGTLVRAGGKWRIYAGAYRTPTVTLSADDLRDEIQVQTLVSRRESFNTVKGTHISARHLYQIADFPAVRSDSAVAEDNGIEVVQTVDFKFTTDPSRAQRLAKILLMQARQPITLTMPCKLSAFRVQAPDTVALDIARFGWSGKVFQCVESNLAVATPGDVPLLGVDLSFRETAPSIYDFAADEDEFVDDAPATDLPNPFDVSPPSAPILIEELYETRDGAGVKAKALLSWVASDDAFVVGYRVRYRLQGAADWIVLPTVASTQVEILDIAPGIYELQVAAVNNIGVESEPAAIDAQEIFGLLAPPADVTGLAIQTISNLAVLSWNRHPDLDVRIGGRFEIRHARAQSGAVWAGAMLMSDAIQGGNTSAVLPLLPGTYLVRAFDSTGIASLGAATVATDGATAIRYANINTVTEDPDFVGAKSGVVAADGFLQLAGLGLFDDITDFDSLEALDTFGGLATSGTYSFAAGFDLGTKTQVRLSIDLGAFISQLEDRIDSRDTLIDEWPDFDGDAGGLADAAVWVRSTDDDPAGSPTWSEWRRLTVGEFNARGFDFEARLSTLDPSYTIRVQTLRVSADEVTA